MTALKPYGVYKESGVEWLGRLPADWDVRRIKMSVASGRNGIWGQEPEGDPNAVWCVRVADFDRRRQLVSSSQRTMRSVTADELFPRRLNRGDLLLEKSGGGENNPVGFVVRYDHDETAVCSNFVARLQLREGMDSRFWTYVHATTYSVRLTQRSIKQTSGIQNLDQASYFNELAPFPSLKTQTRIADFLDHETAQIDDLISKQERLIALLAEKRQALITRAVTKGLDPAVGTKPSGIPWLGAIPAHWKVGPVKHFYDVVLGKMLQREQEVETDALRPYLKAASIRSGTISLNESSQMWFSENEVVSLSLRSGDVLVVEGGSIGQSALVVGDMPGVGFEKSLNRVRPKTGSSSEYFQLYMTIARESGYVAMLCVGATFMHLTAEKLGRMIMPVPPLAEQRQIANELGRLLGRLDHARAKSRRLVDLLQERRSALIAAAVTGKITIETRGTPA